MMGNKDQQLLQEYAAFLTHSSEVHEMYREMLLDLSITIEERRDIERRFSAHLDQSADRLKEYNSLLETTLDDWNYLNEE